jgi:hypothetical protein
VTASAGASDAIGEDLESIREPFVQASASAMISRGSAWVRRGGLRRCSDVDNGSSMPGRNRLGLVVDGNIDRP